MKFNYHTHTSRCRHAVGTDREYVEKAIESGLKTLGISDHAPYVFPNTDHYSAFRMFPEELHAYAESVRALAKEYAKDIRILCGFELEYYPDFHAEEMAFLNQVKPDYLIMGQHFIGNELNHVFARHTEDIALVAYVTQVLAGLATGDFLYLAHPDLAGYHYSDEVKKREYKRLCEGAKRMGIPLEWNLLGLRENRHYPGKEFFSIAAEVGNDIIIGVDAHNPDNFLEKRLEEKSLAMAKELGLNVIDKPLL